MPSIPLSEGRLAFGDDPAGYAAARPEYPEALYERLIQRCGVNRATVAFEVGPGTGLASRRLLDIGIASLHAIEPDRRLAAFLRQSIPSSALSIEEAAFEDATLPPSHFDLGIAATSFHWTEQADALVKAKTALKSGGWWAMWWTHFGAAEEHDPFEAATHHLFANAPDPPSRGRDDARPFALDRDARLSDLSAAGFENAEVAIWRWSRPYTTARLVELYRTFSTVRALDAAERKTFFREFASIADTQFGGCVERPFVTALYTAQRP